MSLRVLGLIPARGGSKGVPHKNLKPLAGRALLDYTVASAVAAERLTRIVVSTDDDETARHARGLGIDVPFMRPAALATDEAPMLPVVQHAVETLERQGDDRYDAVCLLQPSNPLRPDGLVDRCIDELDRAGADSVMTVLPVPTDHNPYWTYVVGDDGALHLAMGGAQPVTRRQDLPPAFHREGSVYVTRRRTLDAGSLYGERIVGVELDPHDVVNIDTLDDWDRAEALVASAGRTHIDARPT